MTVQQLKGPVKLIKRVKIAHSFLQMAVQQFSNPLQKMEI